VRGREGGGGVRDGAVRAALPLRVRCGGAREQGGGTQDKGVRGGRGCRVGLGGGGVRRDGGDDQGRGEAVRAVRVGEVRFAGFAAEFSLWGHGESKDGVLDAHCC